MNIFRKVFILAAVLIVLMGVSKSYSSESHNSQKQEEPISWLEDKVNAQDEIIAWHRKMRNNAARGYASGVAEGPSGSGFDTMSREMQGHCDEIIKAAETLKKELQSFADWHKDKLELNASQAHRTHKG